MLPVGKVAEPIKRIPAQLETFPPPSLRIRAWGLQEQRSGGTANLFNAQAQSQEISWFGPLELC